MQNDDGQMADNVRSGRHGTPEDADSARPDAEATGCSAPRSAGDDLPLGERDVLDSAAGDPASGGGAPGLPVGTPPKVAVVDLRATYRLAPDDAAFEKFVRLLYVRGDCWELSTAPTGTGYGQIRVYGTVWRAHRLSYLFAHGALDPSLELDHLCRNRRCVRPSHLEQVTARVNRLRGVGPTAINAKKVECYRGHSLDDAYIIQGNRRCRTCELEKHHNEKTRAAARERMRQLRLSRRTT